MAITAKANAYRHKKGTFRHQKMREKWKDGEVKREKEKIQSREGKERERAGELFSLVVYLLISETL